MNGPTPIMSSMFTATAAGSPMVRVNSACPRSASAAIPPVYRSPDAVSLRRKTLQPHPASIHPIH